MEISTVTLDQLDTPSRIFRPHLDECAACPRPKAQCPYLADGLLKKRELLDEEETPLYKPSECPEFFADDGQIGPVCAKPPKGEITSPNGRKCCPAVRESNNTVSFSPSKTIPLKMSIKRDVRAKANVSPQKDEVAENDFLSEDEGFKKAINEAISSEMVSGNTSFVDTGSKINSDCYALRYQKCVSKRARNTNAAYLEKRKRKAMAAIERYHLKTRALRISLFWQGKKNFLPSAFQLVRFSAESNKVLIEHQDFSHKGVNHIDESSEVRSLASKLSNVLDGLGQHSVNESYDA